MGPLERNGSTLWTDMMLEPRQAYPIGPNEAYPISDHATLATDEAAFIYSLTAMFGGWGGRGSATEYGESKPTKRRRPSKEKIAFGFERRMNGAGYAVRTPRSFKDEIATDEVPAELSLQERFEKDLNLSRSPPITDGPPSWPPSSTDASPVDPFRRNRFTSGFERLTDDADDGGECRTPRSSNGSAAFGFETRMEEAGVQAGDDAGKETSAPKVEYFQGRRDPRSSKSEMATSPISQDGVAPSIASPHTEAGGHLPSQLPGCHVRRHGARWRLLVAANRRRASVGSEDM